MSDHREVECFVRNQDRVVAEALELRNAIERVDLRSLSGLPVQSHWHRQANSLLHPSDHKGG